ncbi:hypothetical protein HDU84_009410 [Entophlyctis sp. JEL0112]|nr:hypothetical protein HDU84_009410 [Entophlyctis sp. JEL0112]
MFDSSHEPPHVDLSSSSASHGGGGVAVAASEHNRASFAESDIPTLSASLATLNEATASGEADTYPAAGLGRKSEEHIDGQGSKEDQTEAPALAAADGQSIRLRLAWLTKINREQQENLEQSLRQRVEAETKAASFDAACTVLRRTVASLQMRARDLERRALDAEGRLEVATENNTRLWNMVHAMQAETHCAREAAAETNDAFLRLAALVASNAAIEDDDAAVHRMRQRSLAETQIHAFVLNEQLDRLARAMRCDAARNGGGSPNAAVETHRQHQ